MLSRIYLHQKRSIHYVIPLWKLTDNTSWAKDVSSTLKEKSSNLNLATKYCIGKSLFFIYCMAFSASLSNFLRATFDRAEYSAPNSIVKVLSSFSLFLEESKSATDSVGSIAWDKALVSRSRSIFCHGNQLD